MKAKTKHHIQGNAFLLACKICEQNDPSITYNMARSLSSYMNQLILSDAFNVGRVKYFLGKSNRFHAISYRNGKPGYFDENNNFIKINDTDVKKCNLDLNWIAKVIANDIGTTSNYEVEEILPNLLWKIGNIKFEGLDNLT